MECTSADLSAQSLSGQWEAEDAQNLQIEVFDDRYEISRLFEERIDIFDDPHAHGDTFSDQLIAELPNAG